MDFGSESIFSSKDAANWRKTIDYFFVGKLSHYMVTPATSFCDADSNLEKLVGGGSAVDCREKPRHKTFNLVQGTPEGYETSAGLFPTDYLRPELIITIMRVTFLRSVEDLPLVFRKGKDKS